MRLTHRAALIFSTRGPETTSVPRSPSGLVCAPSERLTGRQPTSPGDTAHGMRGETAEMTTAASFVGLTPSTRSKEHAQSYLHDATPKPAMIPTDQCSPSVLNVSLPRARPTSGKRIDCDDVGQGATALPQPHLGVGLLISFFEFGSDCLHVALGRFRGLSGLHTVRASAKEIDHMRFQSWRVAPLLTALLGVTACAAGTGQTTQDQYERMSANLRFSRALLLPGAR